MTNNNKKTNLYKALSLCFLAVSFFVFNIRSVQALTYNRLPTGNTVHIGNNPTYQFDYSILLSQSDIDEIINNGNCNGTPLYWSLSFHWFDVGRTNQIATSINKDINDLSQSQGFFEISQGDLLSGQRELKAEITYYDLNNQDFNCYQSVEVFTIDNQEVIIPPSGVLGASVALESVGGELIKTSTATSTDIFNSYWAYILIISIVYLLIWQFAKLTTIPFKKNVKKH
jgi:hypothetical protein